MKSLLTVVYVLGLAFGLGIYSAWAVTGQFAGFGALTLGQWTSYPQAGTADADPYARAWAARAGTLALGRVEGLTFRASRDSDGARLAGTCSYVLSGQIPSNRLWTLRIEDETRNPLPVGGNRPSQVHGRAVLRAADGSVSITVSDRIAPNNWLYLDHEGPVHLVLTLYDTTIATSTGLRDVTMPIIRNAGCRS